MKILFFAKRGKIGTDEAIEYLKKHFNDVIVYVGERKDEFPADALAYKPDILISYISPWIIPSSLLNNTRKWNINFHPGSPSYPGIGCTNFAIYNMEKEFGVTAHIMEKKVDSGKIIGVKRFPILETDNVYSLTIKSYGYLLILFYETFDYIIKYIKLPECNEKWARKPYTRKQLERLCKITPDMPKNEVERRVKSTEFPGMPGAYIELYGYKFEYNKNR